MRDQLLLNVVLAAADAAPDRLTPIVVALIGTVGAGIVTLVVAFVRKPDGRLEKLEAQHELDAEYIEDLRDQLWQNQITPVDPKPKGLTP